ncbi:MAG TPA: hypothetical protein VG246_04215 [Acidimicrobiales bacterium]|jgi:hypothetical protein|nr:hypothetical protein [Acidimicrobiales bacterium]
MSDAESPKSRAVTYIVTGQFLFAFFIALCMALHPGIVLKWNEGGVSNYGIHIKTAIPYTLALGLLAFYSRRAAVLYSSSDALTRRLRRMLTAYSVIVIVMLFSTYVYTFNQLLRDIHIGFGTVLIAFESFAAIWMFAQLRHAWDGVFLATQLVGALLALVTIVGVLHFLFLAEELANTGFACLLIHTSQRIALVDRLESERPLSLAPLPIRRLKLAFFRAEYSPGQ